MPIRPGPICTADIGSDWIDKGTGALARHTPPAPVGIDLGSDRSVSLPADAPGKLLLAAQCGLPHLQSEVRQRLAPLLSYEGMAVIAGSVLAIGAAHAVGVGFAVDIVVGALTITMIGVDAFDAAKHGSRFYSFAIGAVSEQDFEQAGREFAAFVSLVGINAFVLFLTKGNVRGQAPRPVVNAASTRAAWYTYINQFAFKIPKDKGILWTKIGARHAERLAGNKGLVSLEMILKEEGFYEVYAKQFGTFDNVKAHGLESVTGDIWKMLSERYAASLEGKVTAYVSQRGLGNALSSGSEPVLVDELWQIADLMRTNGRVSHVELIDVSTGRSWIMLRQQVLDAANRSF